MFYRQRFDWLKSRGQLLRFSQSASTSRKPFAETQCKVEKSLRITSLRIFELLMLALPKHHPATFDRLLRSFAWLYKVVPDPSVPNGQLEGFEFQKLERSAVRCHPLFVREHGLQVIVQNVHPGKSDESRNRFR